MVRPPSEEVEDDRSRGRRALPEGTRVYGIQRVRHAGEVYDRRHLEDEARRELAKTIQRDGYVVLDSPVGKWVTEVFEPEDGTTWTWEVYRLKAYVVPV